MVLALEHSKASSVSLSESGHVFLWLMSLRILKLVRDILVISLANMPSTLSTECLSSWHVVDQNGEEGEEGEKEMSCDVVSHHMADIYYEGEGPKRIPSTTTMGARTLGKALLPRSNSETK